MKSTVVTKFRLICGDGWKNAMAGTISFSGIVVGGLVFGKLGDRVGRKNVFFLAIFQTVLCGLSAVFAENFTLYNVLTFLTSMGWLGVYETSFIMGIELVGPDKRVFCAIVIEFFWVLGELLLAGLAWITRDHKYLTLSYLAPFAIYLGLYHILPESLRWLIANKRFVEAEKMLQNIAK